MEWIGLDWIGKEGVLHSNKGRRNHDHVVVVVVVLINERDKSIGNSLAILVPIAPVLPRTPLHISAPPVGDHQKEEEGIEERQDGSESTDQTPRQGHGQVGGVVDLPRVPPPAVNE